MRTFLTAILILIVSIVLSACGSSSKDKDSKNSGTKAASGVTELKYMIEKVGSKGSTKEMMPLRAACTMSIPASCRGSVKCDNKKNDAEDKKICKWLESKDGRKAFEKPKNDPHQACTMIYGGPEKATVTGTILGEEVDVTFSRENGCEIDRWQKASSLWNGVEAV